MTSLKLFNTIFNETFLKVVCPKCEVQTIQWFDSYAQSRLEQEFTCPSCKTTFRSRIVKALSRPRSTGEYYSVEVEYSTGRTSSIEYKDSAPLFEIAVGDLLVFSYLNGTLKVVQNITTRQYMKISDGCYLASYVYGAQSDEVATLRQFRDEVLLRWRSLSVLVDFYYHISPRLLKAFGRYHVFRQVVRIILAPFVWLIHVNR